MTQPRNTNLGEQPMTTYGRVQGPEKRYRRLRFPSFPAATWTEKNPLLQRGEIGAESDTLKMKIGDGITYWNDLGYSKSFADWGDISGNIQDQNDLVEFVDSSVQSGINTHNSSSTAHSNQFSQYRKSSAQDAIDDNLQSQITTNANNIASNDTDIANLQANKADKITDFETPITASNKGATMTEINNLVQLGNKITNCILQIPQNIKLTLNGNQLTLASGSTYYVPNGVGKFNAVTTSTDITYTPSSNGTRLLLMNSAGTNMDAPNITSCYSQESQPSGNSIYWWDLTNNLVKAVTSSGTTSGISLPIALLTVDGDNVTVEEVFNGVGFMGTTIYTTPDLLVAVPNGRNSDGTLKNITTMQTRVNVYTLESFTRTELYAASTQLLAVGKNTYTYDFGQNKILTGTGDQRSFIKIGTVSNNGTYITDIDLDEPFAAVDYNEYAKDLYHINETLEDKASLSEPQTIDGKYTFIQTIDINDSLGMQINRALDSGGTTAWRVYDATNSRQIRALGFYANSKIYNRLSIVGNTGIEGYLNFSMTDDGTMNIELSGTSGVNEYLPPRGDSGASFATTKWVQIELGDKQDSLNSAQLNAVNSGITATKVATYDGYAGQIAGKQNTLTAGSNIRISGNTISATGLAKIDLSNISAEGIDTAVGWGIPDYSAGVVNSTVLPSFTCDQDYLFIFVAYRAAEMAGTITINIDNNQVAIITSNDYGWVYLPIYARKGSVVTTSYSNLTTASCTRFPLLKGA